MQLSLSFLVESYTYSSDCLLVFFFFHQTLPYTLLMEQLKVLVKQ